MKCQQIRGSWRVDGCVAAYLAGWKKLNAPLQLDDLPKQTSLHDTSVSGTKPFSCHIFASSITQKDIYHPLCSYTGAI